MITAHEVNAWEALCSAYDVLVPSIVIAEAHFYYDSSRRRISIDLRAEVAAGRIKEYAAEVSEFRRTATLLHPELRSRVDAGEREALTFLRQNPTEAVWFVTADGGAIEAAVAFDCGDSAQSLETVLRSVGLTRKLPKHHMDDFVKDHRRRGSVALIQGRALSMPTS